MIPLITLATVQAGTAPLSIVHEGQFPAVTLSFNLASGQSLGAAVDAINRATKEIGLPDTVATSFLLRFRPIMMTTMAALLGALPLALEQGNGSELRRPLGISIVGGLRLSQFLTLFTTPVIYLYLDRFASRMRQWRVTNAGASAPIPEARQIV